MPVDLSGTVTVPAIGPVKKKPLVVGAVIAAGAGAYLYYRRGSSSDSGGDVAPAPVDSADAFGQDLTGTGTGGAISGYVDNGSDTAQTGPTDNAQWSQAAISALEGSYDLTAITDALGRYLAHQPLSDLDQRIVQAAIAVAGYPPVGSYSIITGGNTAITVAPSPVTATGVTATTATLTWGAVPGARSYRIYRKDLGLETVGESNDPTWQARGLAAGHGYDFQVAAVAPNGKNGPMSTPVHVATPAVALKAPTGLRVSGTTATTVTLAWSKVAGASAYRMYRGDTGKESVGDSQDTQWQARGLRANTRYTFYVAAIDNNGKNGPSAHITAMTKKA